MQNPPPPPDALPPGQVPLPPYPQQSGYPIVPPSAPGATAAMVCGIISLALTPFACFCWFLEIAAFPLGVVAIVFGFRARAAVGQSRGTLSGGGKATAGLVTGIIAIALALVLVLPVFLIFGAFGGLMGGLSHLPSPSP